MRIPNEMTVESTGRPPSVVFPQELCGPPECANGGVVAGMLAQHLEGPVEVTLRRPVPLEEAVTLERLGSAVVLRRGHEVLALAQPGDMPPLPPEAPTWADALEAAGLRAPPETHPFPTCFVCGPARDPGDGLRLQPGPVRGRKVFATPWIPEPGTGDAAGNVRPEFLWGALDCPGGFAALNGRRPRPLVLGRITACTLSVPRTGDPLIVQAWHAVSEGRRHIVGTALHGLDGTCLAVARATWFDV